MAKVGFWLKGAKGKLAGATVYQQNGETVMREVVSPSNPKTEKQIIQRIIMHTVMQAYSKMKDICDHSFEGIKKGQPTMSYFMSQNVTFARQKIASMQQQGISFLNMYNFVPLGLKGFTPNQYQLSMGSLPSVETTLRDDEEGVGFVPAVTENTYEAVMNSLGLERGDQLTFILIDGNNDASFGQCNFRFARVILDPTDPQTFAQLPMSTPFVTENDTINCPSVRNEGTMNFRISEAGLQFTYSAGLYALCAAVIVSRQVNEKWLRSTTYLTYNAVEEYSLQECIDLAANGSNSPIYAASDAYLNNAGQGGGAGAEASNGGGSSSGSNVSPTPSTAALTSASVDGNVMTQGTTKSVAYAEGTEFPKTVSVVVAANAAAEGKKLVVKNGSTEVASGNITTGAATVSHAWARDTQYSLYIANADGSNAVATGYSFSLGITDNNGSGNAGFDSGD